VLSDINLVKSTSLHAFFDCLAYHHVALQTLECLNLYKAKSGSSMCDGLAAHLKFGNFPNLSSLTIHGYMLTENAAAALIDGLDKGCRAVTSLSWKSDYFSSSAAGRGFLVKALSEASGKLLHSLQTLHLDWSSLTSTKILKFLFDLDIHTKTKLLLPRRFSVQESDFHFVFPSLLPLNIIRYVKGLPLKTLKVGIRKRRAGH